MQEDDGVIGLQYMYHRWERTCKNESSQKNTNYFLCLKRSSRVYN